MKNNIDNNYSFQLIQKEQEHYTEYIKYISENITNKFTSSWNSIEFNSVINSENTYLIACFSNNTFDNIIGFICFSNILDEMEILNISVDIDYRGKGIATKLIENAFVFSKQNNCLTCNLEVNTSNKDAINLYNKLGFNNIYTRKGYYTNKLTNTKEDAYIMTKKL